MRRTGIFLSLLLFCVLAFSQAKVRNVILLIGDGMGLSQTYAAYLANGNKLAIFSMPYTGLSVTSCADRKVTDSGAGGTALATGHKALYGSIGLDENGFSHPSLLKIAKQYGKSTALVCSCELTHATPASFVANVKDRNSQEEIALAYLQSYCDVALGGGRQRFCADKRKDKKNLEDALRDVGYGIVYSLSELQSCEKDKIIGLFADGHLPIARERGSLLPDCFAEALKHISKNENGFFVMLEGSQIDMEAHENRYERMNEETLDFDRCIKAALDFAKADRETLVVVTADHATGGLTLVSNGKKTADKWSSDGHTGEPVPIYAFGPGAERFTGVMQNTDIFFEIYKLIQQ